MRTTEQRKQKESTPYVYGAGTRLSSAYTIGRDGLPCPRWAAEPSSAAYKAWKQGHTEFDKEKQQ